MANLERRAEASVARLSDYFSHKSSGLGLGHALFAEFVGTALFAFVGAASGTPQGNALALAVAVFLTANISGGHLNPAVDVALGVSGHQHWVTSILNIVAQVVGGVAGALLTALLVPHASAAACPAIGHGVGVLRAVGWEAVLTAALVSVYYAVAITPATWNFGPLGPPLAMGGTVYAAASAAKHHLSLTLNPARLLGPALVFLCGGRLVWLLLLGQLGGALLGAFAYALPNLGAGPEYAPPREQLRGIRAAAATVADESESLLPGRS